MAGGYARLASGDGLARDRHKAGRRLLAAGIAEPYLVAGDGRFCTRVMQAVDGVVFAKTGAEGVYCAAIPDQGIGIALKVDDGAGRAAEVALAEIISVLAPDYRTELLRLAHEPVRNVRGLTVGEVRAAPELKRGAEGLARVRW
jgi:L-asparaginase II